MLTTFGSATTAFVIFHTSGNAARVITPFVSAGSPRVNYSGGDATRPRSLQDARLNEGDQHAARVLHRQDVVGQQHVSHQRRHEYAEPAGASAR